MKIIWAYNKGYSLPCWCVVNVLTCVGDSLRQMIRSTESESGDYNCEDLFDGCKLIKRI